MPRRKTLTYAAAKKSMAMADSYGRAHLLMDLYFHMDIEAWFKLLGEEWSGCDNLATYRQDLGNIFGWAFKKGHHLLAMDEAERSVLGAMPDVLRVYRGCYAHNQDGLSWTMERATAEQFPMLNRYRHEDMQPLLLTGTVPRHLAILKMDRQESEVISPFVTVLSVEHIEAH